MAIAAAVAGWLVANVAIAWMLRARPGLAWRSNIMFPVWALVAVASAAVLSLTAVGATLGVDRSPPQRPASRSASRCSGSRPPPQDVSRYRFPGASDQNPTRLRIEPRTIVESRWVSASCLAASQCSR
jgi:hypothetical protein